MKTSILVFAIAVMIISCNAPDNSANMNMDSKAEANKAKVQRFYDEVFNAHNTAVLDTFCVTDFVDHNPDQGHTGKGLDDVKAEFTAFFTGFPDIHATTNFMVAEGDKVVAHITVTGTNSGAMGDMPATNKQISIDGIDIIAIKDGMATDRWGIFDNMKMMAQLGMMSPPADSSKMETGNKK